MANLLISGGTVLDPGRKLNGPAEVLILGGRVAFVGPAAGTRELLTPEVVTLDASGLLVTPGLIDMHVHFREPGMEEEETIASGAAAAVWQVKRPLPHPSSIRSSLAPGSRERQLPRRAWGSEISHWAHRSIRGTRFFFLLIRIGFPPLMADANLRNPGEFRHFLAIIP